jgi:hypothetical protein
MKKKEAVKIKLQSKEGQDLIAELKAVKAKLQEILDKQAREELDRQEEEEEWFGDKEWLDKMKTKCGQIDTIEKFTANL